ncbi:MAG: MerR family transcriptional regulator [Bryobacter sp.]|nr:MerR family transcriptional regulator [Bryobacter sp. CoA8 C33]
MQPGIRTVDELPAKLYFRIGEVARLTGLKQHVLRYWETEFPAVAPKKMGSNHRMYRRKDVESILEIKHLLYEKRYTIEGARKHLESRSRGSLKGRKGSGGVVSSSPMPKKQESLFGSPVAQVRVGNSQEIEQVKAELRAILKILMD